MHHSNSFSIPAIRDFVPERLKPWIVLFFVIIIQLSSGGIYLAAVSEMVGSMALMQEDIMMAGYASMVGMALTFTIMFRLKFRFCTRTALITCATVLIISNLTSMHTTSVPVLVTVSFIAGIFRMWATFECNSTIQLWLTPKRDMSVFFCFIYLLVQSSIQLSGLTTIYISFLAKWEYMHLLVIASLGFVILLTHILFRNYRSMKKLPLYGIDWLGALLWGLIVLCITFICLYGDHYDWFHSVYIRIAAFAAIVMLILNVWRAGFIRHPYLSNKIWTLKEVYITIVLYLVVNFLLAPSHLLEHMYVESILGYDSLNTISLNWIVLLGIITACLFTYITFAKYKWSYKRMAVIGFSTIILSLMIFYFTIDYNQSKLSLLLPIFLRSFGYVIIGICFLTALTRLFARVPFHYFPQALSVQAFFSVIISGVLAAALLTRVLKVLIKKNSMLLSIEWDNVNTLVSNTPTNSLYEILQVQSIMVSMKEIYGWLSLIGLFCLFLFMIKESSINAKSAIHPPFRKIRRFVKHQLRIDKNKEEELV